MITHTWRRGPRRDRLHNRQPSLALIVACVALVVALGGTSYAALTLPAGVVGPLQLRKHAVTPTKLAIGAVVSSSLAARAVTGRNLADAAVGTRKLTTGAVTSSKLKDGAVTAPKLAPGAITAAAVPPGAGVVVTYHYGTVVLTPRQQIPAFVACPHGTTVVGGGATADQTSVTINDSAPFSSAANAWTGGVSDSWGVFVTNTDTAQSHTVGIYAVCIATGR